MKSLTASSKSLVFWVDKGKKTPTLRFLKSYLVAIYKLHSTFLSPFIYPMLTSLPACNCSDTGMVACTRRPGFVECTCQPGYAGTWCEECAPGNFRAGKECRICPCSNLTSTAECKMGEWGALVNCVPIDSDLMSLRLYNCWQCWFTAFVEK